VAYLFTRPDDPTPEDVAYARASIERGRAVLKAARLAELRRHRAEDRQRRGPVLPRFETETVHCAYCGIEYEARAINRPVLGRYCSNPCRQLSYQHRIATAKGEPA
jgi:hypothetical protein